VRIVLIVDDHPVVVDGLRNAFAADEKITLEFARNTSEARRRLRKVPVPDLILIDIHLGPDSGFSLIEEWRDSGLDIPFAILTASRDWSYLQKARQYDARGYLLKTSEGSEIARDIHSILSGEEVYPTFYEKQSSTSGDLVRAFHSLTDREKEVLQCIHAGLLNREIAERLQIGVRTVETHRAHAMEKLGARSSVQLSLILIQIQHLFTE
jgi:two-component system response regulator NreC